MEPLEPNDPLWKLLGKARPVEPRGNFTQNVLRAVRNVPQDHGWLAQTRATLADWWAIWQRPALLSAATAVLALVAVIVLQPETSTPPVAAVAPSAALTPALADDDMALIVDDFELPLTGLDHMDALVAMDDTTALTDTEIAYLLY